MSPDASRQSTKKCQIVGDLDRGGSLKIGGWKILSFQGPLKVTPFYRNSIENRRFGGQMSKSSRSNFRVEFVLNPPPYPGLRHRTGFDHTQGGELGPRTLVVCICSCSCAKTATTFMPFSCMDPAKSCASTAQRQGFTLACGTRDQPANGGNSEEIGWFPASFLLISRELRRERASHLLAGLRVSQRIGQTQRKLADFLPVSSWFFLPSRGCSSDFLGRSAPARVWVGLVGCTDEQNSGSCAADLGLWNIAMSPIRVVEPHHW